MTDINVSPISVMKVIQSWERARQRNGFDEQLGIDTLLVLFRMDPRIKQIFGFAFDKEVKAEGVQRMGILIHGLQIVKMLDAIFSALGLDDELLSEILAETGEQHCQLGLSPDHFTLLCRALLEVLEKTMGDDWTSDTRAAWFQVIRVVNVAIAKNMQKRMEKVCQKISAHNLQKMDLSPSSHTPRAA